MAERKHVINLHTSTGVDAPSGASLYLGEIAVQHTPDNPALWIKMGTSEDSEIYEKFIGLTEITNIINQNSILGSGYTYSGLPYVNSSTTIADAYSALTKELFDDELVVSAALNELNDKIDQISGNTSAYDDLLEYIQEDEEVIAGALNVLNERVGVVETHMTGDYIPLTGYELASGTTEEELIIGDEDTVNEAFGKIQKQMLDNEEAVAAGLNDLNQRVEANTEAISHNTGVTVLSGVVRSLVNEVEDIWNEFEDYTPTGVTEELSGVVQSISAKTSGVLTINVNGEEQGKYSPSADTTVNLEVIQDITGADVLLTGYEIATGETEEELAIVATDTVNEAFGKLQKQNYDNEAVTAGALNDLDERLRVLESESGSSSEDLLALSAAVETFSAAVIDNEYVVSSALNDLNDKILEISGHTGGDYGPLSAATHAHVTNNDIHVTAAQKTFWTNGANSGASAYTAVTALSAATTAINNTLTTVSGAADSKITALSAATTGISNNLTALSAATTALTAASANYFDGAEYVSSAKTIIFTNNGTKKGEIDATAFIKDGMVSSVTIVGENMVISFNTDAGREDITLALTDIFDPDNYYNKTDINNGVSASTKALSGGTVAHINDADIHVTSAEKSAWFSGASAYTMVSALSASVITLSAITEENELIVATALNDINDRVSALEAVSGAGADLSALSASVVTNKSNVETLSGAVVNQARVVSASLNELNDRVGEVSGSILSVSTRVTQTQNALTSHTANANIHVTAAEKTAWQKGIDSGVSAYTAIQTISWESGTGINSVQQKGGNANAMGDISCAEGSGTTTISEGSHAEGRNTVSGAKGAYYKHEDGDVTFDTTNKTVTVNLITTQNGTEPYNPNWVANDEISIVNDGKYDKYFKVQSVTNSTVVLVLIDQTDELPFTSVIAPATVNYDDFSIINLSKPTEGIVDLGQSSHSEGTESRAINMYAHAEGYDTEAYGQYSHAEGRGTSASYAAHSEGRLTKAFGAISHAEGNSTIAEGYCAHSEGQGSGAMQNTLGPNSTALPYIGASGEKAHTEGTRTTATMNSAHAEGFETFATGNRAHTEGMYTQASASDSHAEGNSTKAAGTNSHAEGLSTIAIGNSAHAEGQGSGAMQNTLGPNGAALAYTGATGDKSHTEGTRTSATMNSAHAEGFETFATANRSHTEGGYTQAKGIDSHAEGYCTITNNSGEHAQGRYNVSTKSSDSYGDGGNTIHSIGIGTSTSNRKNAMEVMQNGDTYIYGIGGYDGTNYIGASSLQTVITTHTGNNNIHVTAAQKTTWTNGANSGASAYTGYTAHSAKTITSRTSSEMHLPTVTSADEGKILRVVNGAWTLVDPTTIYTGSGQPSSDLGTDGDIYLQTS